MYKPLEYSPKIHLRWYLTLYTVAKFFRVGNSLCWRRCGQVGMLTQMLWSCLQLHSYWNAAFRYISDIIGILTRTSFKQAVLIVGMENFLSTYRPIAMYVLFATQLTVAKIQKSDAAPNIAKVKIHIHLIFVFEKLVAISCENVKHFISIETLGWLSNSNNFRGMHLHSSKYLLEMAMSIFCNGLCTLHTIL